MTVVDSDGLRSRFFLVVAAVSVITLAASSPIYSAVRGAHLTRNTSASPIATAGGTSTASSDCSEATARQVVERRLDVNIFDLPDPVRQVLCGSFTGPGSNAMAVTIGAPTCWPIQNWAVFRFTAGDWQLVLNTPAYLVPPLVAVGSDIRETTGVHRSGDSRCFFNGGTRARIWHWDGARLVAGPWKQVTPGAAATTSPGHFKTPSGNIFCGYFYDKSLAGVDCVIKSGYKPPLPRRRPGCSRGYWVVLRATGGVQTRGSVCPGEPDPEGPFIGAEQAWVLGFGKTWSHGGLRCVSAFKGLTCRNKSGHGFFLSRAHWRAF
jgi:hypothetical protein